MKPGDVLQFKRAVDKATYGNFAIVVEVQSACTSRRFGTFVVLVDLVAANGTHIQWRASEVRRRFVK